MKQVRATLSIELNIECPKCGRDIELLSDTDLNDEGDLLNQVITDDRWKIDPDERLECSAVCPDCSVDIEVRGVDW